MNRVEFEEKIKKIDNYGEILEKIKNVTDNEELLDVLKEYGIEITEEELEDIIPKDLVNSEDEISEEDLENVAGGKCIHGKGLPHYFYNFLCWLAGIPGCKG